MKQIITAIITFILISSCNYNPHIGGIEKEWVIKINDKCKMPDRCIINIKDLTNFSWDTMFFFQEKYQKEDIEKILGVPFTEYKELTRKIVFLKAGKIVYMDQLSIDIESLINEQIIFNPIESISQESNYLTYTPNTAVFKVTKKDFSKGIYYELKQIHL